jgi:hypothetical protein
MILLVISVDEVGTHARSVVNAFCRANGRIGFRRKLITNESIDGFHGTTNKGYSQRVRSKRILTQLGKEKAAGTASSGLRIHGSPHWTIFATYF